MIVNLDNLPCLKAVAMIKWCWEQEIDKEKCVELVEAMTIVPVPEVEWSLNIPDKYLTLFLLKWS